MSDWKVKEFKYDLLSYYSKNFALLFIGALIANTINVTGWVILIFILPYILIIYVTINLLKRVYNALKEINFNSINPLLMCIMLVLFPPLIFYIYFTYKYYYIKK